MTDMQKFETLTALSQKRRRSEGQSSAGRGDRGQTGEACRGPHRVLFQEKAQADYSCFVSPKIKSFMVLSSCM